MELKIYDDIVASQEKEMHAWMFGTDGVSFRDIDDFIAQIPKDDNNIDLYIHCCGGSVSEGWAIVDKLRATGKTISATIDGMCASMAVSIFLSASVRKAHKHATLRIHKPMYPAFTIGDNAMNEDDLKRLATDLERETQKMLDWYVERTGADRNVLETLMCEDKDINAEDALALGFVHEIIEPMSANVRRQKWNAKRNDHIKTNTNTKKENAMKKTEILSAIASLLGLDGKVNIIEDKDDNNVQNFVLKATDGTEVTIDKPEGEDVAVGDVASPDGEFTLEDGRTIVVVAGIVTEVKEKEEEVEEEVANPEDDKKDVKNEISEDDYNAVIAENEALKAENEALKAELDELKKNAPSAEDKSILEKVNVCGGLEWLNKVATSNYVPKSRDVQSNNASAVNSMTERIALLKSRMK